MKTIPAGRVKRITYDPAAVEANRPRVRRREPVFVIEIEEGDTFRTVRAYSIRVEGVTETSYHIATGFIRFVTTSVVSYDDIGATSDNPAPEPTTPQTKAKKSK